MRRLIGVRLACLGISDQVGLELRLDGQKLFGAQALSQHGFEFVVDHISRVDFSLSIEFDDAGADFFGVIEIDVQGDVEIVAG